MPSRLTRRHAKRSLHSLGRDISGRSAHLLPRNAVVPRVGGRQDPGVFESRAAALRPADLRHSKDADGTGPASWPILVVCCGKPLGISQGLSEEELD